jgi:Spy/CpxP family protein refolding chaperone
MDKWIRTLLMLIFALCFSFAVAHAAEKMPGGMFKDLGLTAGQEKQMQSLFEQQRTEEKKDFEKIKELQQTMDQEFLKDRPDETKIKSTVNEIKQIQMKLLDKHFDRLFALRKILTPEQFRKFTEKGRKMRGKRAWGFNGFWLPHRPTGEGFAPSH